MKTTFNSQIKNLRLKFGQHACDNENGHNKWNFSI